MTERDCLVKSQNDDPNHILKVHISNMACVRLRESDRQGLIQYIKGEL